jgi:hypothetical protein
MRSKDPTATDVARALASRRWRGVSAEERRLATAPGRTAAIAAKAKKRDERSGLQAAAQIQLDAAIAAGAIPPRPSPQTIAHVADVVAGVDLGDRAAATRSGGRAGR